MLTYSSDSLPPIVCPMEEDAIPPHPFCSAPPHSEPPHSEPQPPPLPSLASTTPSCENDGKSGSRKGGEIKPRTTRKHCSKDDETAERPPTQAPTSTKREGESGMVCSPTQPESNQSDSGQGHGSLVLSVPLVKIEAPHVQPQQPQTQAQRPRFHHREWKTVYDKKCGEMHVREYGFYHAIRQPYLKLSKPGPP
ncbi:hypothetical protein N1851_004467 [Merluccius polli]|uniref:Uncharacterized protein n=1 Tax=Merluccius polli TaxID=89951 RepID=A0AA47N8V6_MERPO|nr:hypothetical protein N1851_004467 [Merluccius polli]